MREGRDISLIDNDKLRKLKTIVLTRFRSDRIPGSRGSIINLLRRARVRLFPAIRLLKVPPFGFLL